jgi:hypothetical protein
VVSARAKVAIEIPPDFHDRMLRNEGAQVLVLVDGSESTVASTAVGAAGGVALSQSVSKLAAHAGGGGGQIEARPACSSTPTRAPPTI